MIELAVRSSSYSSSQPTRNIAVLVFDIYCFHTRFTVRLSNSASEDRSLESARRN